MRGEARMLCRVVSEMDAVQRMWNRKNCRRAIENGIEGRAELLRVRSFVSCSEDQESWLRPKDGTGKELPNKPKDSLGGKPCSAVGGCQLRTVYLVAVILPIYGPHCPRTVM